MRNSVSKFSEVSNEDRNSPFVENNGFGPKPLSESVERGDGYVVFSPEDPEDGGTSVVLKWGGNPPEKNKQQKDNREEQKDQNKGKEKGKEEKGGKKGKEGNEQDQSGQEGTDSEGSGGSEETGGSEGEGNEKGTQSDKKGGGGKGKGGKQGGEESEKNQSGQGAADSEGTEGTRGDEEGGKEKGTQSDQRGGGDKGKGEKRGGEEGEESEGGGEGDETGGKGGKSQGGDDEYGGGEKEDRSNGDGGGDLDLDKISGQDILGRRRSRGESDDEGDDEPRRPPPPGPREPRKKGDEAKDKSGKPGKSKPGESGEDDSAVEVSSDITDVPPQSQEEDPEILDVFFNKDRKEVTEKENKIIRKSFVFKSGDESVEVFHITPKGKFSSGDRSHIRKLANLVYYLYEPYLKTPGVNLDPGVPVISSPISSRGLRSDQPHGRPKISYGALSTVDQVDFSKLIVFIDVSGSMDMVMVSRVINSYFQSVFTALRKHHGKLIRAVVVLHGTKVGVFGITSPWVTAAQTIAGVAESSRDLVGMGNGSESTLTDRIVDILRTVSPIPGIGQFINGQVPLLWISDFYWAIKPGNQLTNFLREKPALLISTVGDPGDVARNPTNRGEETFASAAFGTARTIMSKVPYGALIYFPSFVGASTGQFTPGSPSGGSAVRVYAKGEAYNQLSLRRDKLGQVSIVSIR